ncbi:MAG: alanine dehydrogenase [SAR202 cluster bacterium]|nr:alanine dehydrogenase [SAR202 cluster bacterium]
MIIGIPREVKNGEHRVGLTPDKVDVVVKAGLKVVVESGAGAGASFKDEDYKAAGASIVPRHEQVYEQADIVAKVKEPQPEEFELLREELTLFCYLHLAAEPPVAKALLQAKVAGVAYETVQEPNGSLPLLYPMSEIAGRLAPQVAARLLQSDYGGAGRLLGGVPGTEACRFIVVGGGTVGFNAAFVATGLGSRVTIFDVNLERLRYIEHITRGSIKALLSTPSTLPAFLARADVVVGAVLVPGAKAPRVITKEMVARMKEKAVLIDVAIDQGGSVEGIRPTSLAEPTYKVNGVTHYAVTNIPGMVANTSSVSLANATYPYLIKLANTGIEKLVRDAHPLAKGLNTYKGHVTHPAVAEALGEKYTQPAEALQA